MLCPAHPNSPVFFPGVVVTQLSATDADFGANGRLVYRLESGAQDRFLVDSLSGAVLVGNATLDREERGSYRLVVVATDRGKFLELGSLNFLETWRKAMHGQPT